MRWVSPPVPQLIPRGWPNPFTTGVPPETVLTTITLSGSLWRESTDGVGLFTTETVGGVTWNVYTGFDFQSSTQYVYVDGVNPNVKFRNCNFYITGLVNNTSAQVQTAAGATNTWFERCTFNGGVADGVHNRNIEDTNSHLTVIGCKMLYCGDSAVEKNDGTASTTMTVRDNYIQEFKGWDINTHADGFQCGGARSVIVQHNTILIEPYRVADGDQSAGNNSDGCIACFAEIGNIGAVYIEGNYLSGGGIPLRVIEQGTVFTDSVVVANNVFDRYHYASLVSTGKAGVFGTLNSDCPQAKIKWANNMWEDRSPLSFATAIS